MKDALKVLIGRAAAVDGQSLQPLPKRFACPVCNTPDVTLEPLPFQYFRELNEHQHVHSIFQYETLNIEHYACSTCGASDRDRLYALYLKRRLLGRAERLAVLDIAPAAALTRCLKAFPQLAVRTADLYMNGVDDRVDITDMRQYDDGRFDIFICSHVFEHVPNDIAAMKELYRILKRGGWGIAMTPIHLGLTAIEENPSLADAAMRWKYFGQDDHVRLYSKSGFVERLQSVGFKVEQLDRGYFGARAFDEHGIHPRSVLYIASK